MVTVAAAKTIKLYAAGAKDAAATWSGSGINSSSDGRTRLSYLKVN